MANNKDNMKSGSQSSMGNQPGQMEGQGSHKNSGRESQSQQGSGKHGQQAGSQGNFEDDDMTTAGGRKGKFSDSQSGDGQWSPGSKQESDR